MDSSEVFLFTIIHALDSSVGRTNGFGANCCLSFSSFTSTSKSFLGFGEADTFEEAVSTVEGDFLLITIFL